MKYCPFCGRKVQDGMSFCPECGKRLLTSTHETVSNQTNETVVKETPDIIENESGAVFQQGKKKKNAIVGMMIALIAVAVIGGLFALSNGSETKASRSAKSVLYLEVYDNQNNMTSTASGFIIDDGMTLVTNYHVIENAYRITATTPDSKSSVDVNTVLAASEASDLAILRCKSDIGVEPLKIEDSDTVKQGDNIYAVGYPLGLTHTMSDGVVSSRYTDNNIDVLQVSAPISNGSSGGALLNEAGLVIGVTTGSYEEGQNLNIAIASNEITEMLDIPKEEVTLMEYYKSNSHPYTLRYILDNREKLDGEIVEVEAVVSSTVIFDLDGEQWVDYIMVSTSEEVFGYEAHGYGEEFFEDDQYQEYFEGYEDNRCENYEALGTEITDPIEIYRPGDEVILTGKVNNVQYKNEDMDIDWHHVILEDVNIFRVA